MTEGASSRLFNPLLLKLHCETEWIGIHLLERGEYMRLPFHLDHLLVIFVEDPDVVRVGGVGAARRRRPINLYRAEGGRGGHGVSY